MRLETGRTVVRSLRDTDLDNFAALTGDPEAMRYVGDGNPLTREQTANWIVVTHANERKDGWTTWAIADPVTDELIGFAGLVHGNDDGAVEVTYAIAPEHRGRGLATDVVRALVVHGLRRVTEVLATVDPANASSLSLLERLGFSAVLTRYDVHGQLEILYRVDADHLQLDVRASPTRWEPRSNPGP